MSLPAVISATVASRPVDPRPMTSALADWDHEDMHPDSPMPPPAPGTAAPEPGGPASATEVWGPQPGVSSMAPPAGPPFAPVPRPAPLRLPLIGHTYPEVTRTPRLRWWQPVLAWPVALVLSALALVAPMLVLALVGFATGDPGTLSRLEDVTDPVMMTVLNISLALLIAVSLIAFAVGSRVAPRFLHSVEGRLRLGWLLRCMLVLLPLYALYVGGAWFLAGAETRPRPEGWLWLLLITLVLTPFQAAGEEYLFRGFVVTTIGSLFTRPVVGLVVAGVVSSALFAAAHGSTDPWIVIDLAAMAAGCCYLVWRTGGLEAAVALHTVNNIVVGVVGIFSGTVAEGYVDSSTTSTPLDAVTSVAWTVIVVAILDHQSRRVGLVRTVPESVGARP